MATVRSILDWLGVSSAVEVVQSLIALGLTATMVYMVVSGRPVSDAWLTIYTAVISYYFGQRAGRASASGA